MTPVEAYPGGYPRRWRALSVLCLALAVIVIDNTILAVAFPSIQHGLHTDETGLQWIGSAYGLVLAGLLLPLAVVGDRRGRKGLLMLGLVLFGTASVAAAFASSATGLAVARGAMGVGGACTMPSTLSVLGNIFPEHERGRAIAVWSGVAGIATAVGPVVGGLLLARFWWGSVFLVNVPVVLLALQERDEQQHPGRGGREHEGRRPAPLRALDDRHDHRGQRAPPEQRAPPVDRR